MTRWLDRLTGRVTMYRLMVLVLGVIAAIAVLLSLVPGGLAYSPVALLATLATFLVVTPVSGWLIGRAFRTTPHVESSVITALLLFFVFFPSARPGDLLVYALVAVIANLSKYALAVRGRHLFNPVAIAALVIAFTQLSAATWWVATPNLLAPVIIGGFLVVYRTRRFALVGVFLAVTVVVSLLRLGLTGTDVASAFALTLGSGPAIFFAVFMLDEPQTLPPRRWQQLVEAAVVGVLFSLEFTLGPLYTSPELALVVGNLLAFFFGQRRSIQLDFVGSRSLTPTTRELVFSPRFPVSFQPGQYLELALPHAKSDSRGHRRIFSISSRPDATEVTFALRIPEVTSSFKRGILELAPGTRLRGTSVGGDFLLPRDASIPLLLVAGGIGITPFMSQLQHLAASGEKRDIVLVYAGSDELAYVEELAELDLPVLVVAPTMPPNLPDGWRYLGSGHLTGAMLEGAVPNLAERVALISGPPALVTSLRNDLRSLGVRRVKTDYFSGY
jgi:ferredoxin-NADP reductase